MGKTTNGAISNPRCEICNGWHLDEWCPSVWTTFDSSRDATRKIPAEHMTVTCYNCGGAGGKSRPHWGGDCPSLPQFIQEMLVFDTWSSKNANRYIVNDDEVMSSDEGEVDEGYTNGGGSVQPHQLAQLNDWY